MQIYTKNRFILVLLLVVSAIIALLWYADYEKTSLDRIAYRLTNQLHTIEKNDLELAQKIANIKSIPEIAQLINTNRISTSIFQIFEKDSIVFWSDNKVIIQNLSEVEPGTSFQLLANGWYMVQKNKFQSRTILSLTSIHNDYAFENKFLINQFNERFDIPTFVQLSEVSAPDEIEILSINGEYLFSLDIDEFKLLNTPRYHFIFLWILIFISFFIVLHTIAKNLWAMKNYAFAAVIVIVIPFWLRWLMLEFQLPPPFYSLKLFSPTVFASGYWLPSLGDLFINVLILLWIAMFYARNLSIAPSISAKPIYKYLLTIVFFAVLYVLSENVHNVFRGLVINSNISFDFTNIVSLNSYSLIGFIILSVAIWGYFLVCLALLRLFNSLGFSDFEKIWILTIGLLVCVFLKIVFDNFYVFFALVAVFLVILDRNHVRGKTRLNFPQTVLIVFLFSIIIASKLNRFLNYKEQAERYLLAQKLESASDPVAEFLFTDIERSIQADALILNYFKTKQLNREVLIDRLQKIYFSGYFSKYDTRVYEFFEEDINESENLLYDLAQTRRGADALFLKPVSDYFFQSENQPGLQHYFGSVPIKLEGKTIGAIIFDLSSKFIEKNSAFPELLLDGNVRVNKENEAYSYAFYNNGLLVNTYGNYSYGIRNLDFINLSNLQGEQFVTHNGYNHLVYQPSVQSTIIVSKPKNSFFIEAAIFSYIFSLALFFTVIIFGLRSALRFIEKNSYNLRYFRLKFLLSSSRILFKTRIQLSFTLAVVFSLIVVGWVTLENIKIQYKEEQTKLTLDRINLLEFAFNTEMVFDNKLMTGEDLAFNFLTFSQTHGSDLNLYDANGKLINSTQPKLFDRGLLSNRINPKAAYEIFVLGKNEYIANERIGLLNFTSAYLPIRDSNNTILGFINFPYFANQAEYDNKISSFFNSLINVYAFLFVLIGFLAFFLANSITNPLKLLEQNFKITRIGKNEPIPLDRNDEIGSLVKEYNNMLNELEISTQKLAETERETAWREMARQVAHEIKNPLTPLKLGVQHLERSWKDNDPNFKQKFEKFTQSFIQQIDSLSAIATEFSNFAQMPETQKETLDIVALIDQVATIFKQSGLVEITIHASTKDKLIVFADKDQLLRSFNNLLKNASQAIPDNVSGKINIHLKKENQTLFITIRDNGSGIPLEIQHKIFQPNFTTKSSGMGLGLAFVKNAIQNAGGSIKFESIIGRGTTFHISLPLYQSA